ncbi:hypothetical protein SeMB42_g06813 [Synchytrium endobioticum]|uniref:Probable vacuolar protein sorting-associated protein 16 homolog n=1 Tax=Synchytrium endobioticum TaxID=286115 RepID=A0A507CJH3_9FUNG|nr:hypothetical protein SeMB42_g06813 [Synchytrium endobioticum]TPX49873.1 hypothetical protein SeLEV6574_g01222 [Synchytrium endobioticum]
MGWRDIHLSNYLVASASFGGPMAIIRDDNKVLNLMNQSVKPIMSLYSSAGRLLHQFQWDKGKLVGMGWSNTEKLVCVLDFGSIRIYDIQGQHLQFSLGQDAKDFGVVDCQIWESGLVVRTGNNKLVAVLDLETPRPKSLADTSLDGLQSWTVIPPHLTLSRHLEVLLAIKTTIITVDISSAQDQLLQQGPFLRISASPNGKYLALFTADGRLWVVSSDFQKSLAEFATNSNTPPLQMAWCGTDSVVLHWPDTLLVVGPFGDWIKYTYDGVVHMVTEIDGVRILTPDKCEFLQRVPTATEDVFKIGSTKPGAILYDAMEHFERQSPKADESIRSIKMELAEAVDSCIEAAGHEFVPSRQKALLKAASFGKCSLEHYNAEKFVNMCQTVRVLNAVRDGEIGIPLTYSQYTRLTPQVLINRLVQRHHHLLALRVCEYLKLDIDRALTHWASVKVQHTVGDDEGVARLILDKLGGNKSGISYAEVAKVAYTSGHTKLATRLLEHEPQASNQVPLLLGMNEDEIALVKAIESGDSDLVYLVLFRMKKRLPVAEFFRIINGKPMACNLLEAFCKQQDRQLLKDFYYQDDRRTDSANVVFLESYEAEDINARTNTLKIAHKLYQDDKDRALEAKALEEDIKLLQAQVQLERDTNHTFVGQSVSETLFKALLLGQGPRAQKLKTDFKVPDKRFWWIKTKALVQLRNMDGLEKFSKSAAKFGVVPIIDTLIKAHEWEEARKWVEQLIKAGGQEAQTHTTRYMEILQSHKSRVGSSAAAAAR